MRRLLAAAVLAGCFAAAMAGCSSSDDGATTTTQATTTTKPEITDEEITANIDTKVRPVLDDVFEPDQVDCIVGVLKDGATGVLSADDVLGAYQERCDIGAPQVTGVLVAAQLVDRGADQADATCVGDAIAALTPEQVDAMTDTATADMYATCGIDQATLSD